MKKLNVVVLELEGNETEGDILRWIAFGKKASKELSGLLEDLRYKKDEPCKSVPASELVRAIEQVAGREYQDMLNR